MAKHFGFSMDTAWEKLPTDVHKLVLYGTGKISVEFNYINDRGDKVSRNHPFEGVINNMQRRYRETESNMVREDLGKYLNMQPCPSCDGSRLRTEARHVFIDGLNLPQITSKAVGTCADYFAELKLAGKQGQIADKIVKEIRLRLDFLVNVGLDYLTLYLIAHILSGG